MRKIYKFAVLPFVVLIAFLSAQSLSAQAKPPTFFVAIYEKGSAWDEKKPVIEQTGIKDHGAHIRSLGDKLVGGSPFGGVPKGDTRIGMVIFRAVDLKEAEQWLENDPFIISKVAKATVFEWTPIGWQGPAR